LFLGPRLVLAKLDLTHCTNFFLNFLLRSKITCRIGHEANNMLTKGTTQVATFEN